MPQMTFDNMYSLIWADPISGAQTVKAQHQSYRRRKYEFAVLGYALAAKLTLAPHWLKDFYGLPFFTGGHRPNAENLLLHCMQYLYEDRTGSDSDRAGAHASAMASLFDARTDPKVVLKMLTEFGFRGLGGRCVLPPNPPSAQTRRLDTLDDTTSAEPLGENESDTGRHDPPVPRAREPEGIAERRQTRTPPLKDVLKRYLLVAMDPLESMHDLFSLPIGEARCIVISRVDDTPSGLVEFQGKLMSNVPDADHPLPFDPT